MAQPTTVVNFTGHKHFRNRLILSILSGKTVRITKIRPEDNNPGLRGARLFFLQEYIVLTFLYPPDYEISLLRLLEKVTNGTIIEISVTGAISHFNS